MTGDSHAIYNSSGERINTAKDVFIGEHVWIGYRATLLKGTRIADGSIIGTGSIANKTFMQQNCVIVGNPAKVVKENIIWNKNR